MHVLNLFLFTCVLFLITIVSGAAFFKLHRDYQTKYIQNETHRNVVAQICHEMRGHVAAVRIGLETFRGNLQTDDQLLVSALQTAIMANQSQEHILLNRVEMAKLISGEYRLKKNKVEVVSLIIDIIGEYSLLGSLTNTLFLV